MKDPAALFFIDNWYVATTGMKPDVRAYYLDLILIQFDIGSLPNEIEELAVICRVRHSEFEVFKQVFEQVLRQKFILNEKGRLENEFAMEIIRKRELFKQKRSDAGKLSYVLKYYKQKYNISNELELFIKSEIDLNFDIKNEHMLEQVFKQIGELYINGNGNGNINRVIGKEGMGEKQNEEIPEKTWKNDFETYKSGLDKVYDGLLVDQDYLKVQERLNPNIDIKLSIEKAYINFWSTQAGWKHKKKSKSNELDWKSTLTKAIDMNKVYKQRVFEKPNSISIDMPDCVK